MFVPKTSSGLNLPPLDAAREDVAGEHVSKEVMSEMWGCFESGGWLCIMFLAGQIDLVPMRPYPIHNATTTRLANAITLQ